MKYTISIEGMTCNHCVNRVQKALMGVDGMEQVNIDLSKNEAYIVSTGSISEEKIRSTVDDAGYDVVNIQIAD